MNGHSPQGISKLDIAPNYTINMITVSKGILHVMLAYKWRYTLLTRPTYVVNFFSINTKLTAGISCTFALFYDMILQY